MNTPSHGCKVYARGLTAIQDIAFGPKDHKLYVTDGTFGNGRLLRVR